MASAKRAKNAAKRVRRQMALVADAMLVLRMYRGNNDWWLGTGAGRIKSDRIKVNSACPKEEHGLGYLNGIWGSL